MLHWGIVEISGALFKDLGMDKQSYLNHMWGVISHPCPKFNIGLAKLLLKT